MSDTITATTGNGNVLFSVRTGKVCGGDYRGIENIGTLNVEATAANVKGGLNHLKDRGCPLVYCTFTTKDGGRHDGVPYPYKK